MKKHNKNIIGVLLAFYCQKHQIGNQMSTLFVGRMGV